MSAAKLAKKKDKRTFLTSFVQKVIKKNGKIVVM
jgi:hypothetical protein